MRLGPDSRQRHGPVLAGGLVAVALADAPAPTELLATGDVDGFLRRLLVKREGKSNIVSVSFTADSAELAADIANAVAEGYVAQQGQLMRRQGDLARDALAQRVAALRAEVESNEAALAAAEAGAAGGAAGLAGDSARRVELERELRAATAEHAVKEARLLRLRSQLQVGDGPLGDGQGSASLQNLEMLRAEAVRREAELAAQLGERHPKLQDARAERRQLEQRIAAERQSLVEDFAVEVRSAAEREAGLRAALDQSRDAALAESRAAGTVQALARRVEVSRRLYESALIRLDGLGEARDGGQPGVRLISPASPPVEPAFPKPRLLLTIGGIVSVVLALCGVYALEASDRGLRSGEQVARVLGVPALGLVPAIGHREAMGIAVQDYPLERPHSRYAEALRGVLTSLALGPRRETGRVLLVTSSVPDEGKSTLALSLARVAVMEGRRVLLVDGDLRRPTLHRLIGREATLGLAEMLKEGVRFEGGLPSDPRSRLKLIPGSAKPSAWSALLLEERLAKLLEEARRGFDLVIVDTAPVLAVNDARLLAGLADQILFLVRWERTPAAVVQHCLEQLGEARSKVAGAVLSQVDLRRHARYGFSDASLAYTRFEGYYAG
jgi:capsular exopolysaccharide synthesis family protein